MRRADIVDVGVEVMALAVVAMQKRLVAEARIEDF